MSTIRHLSWRDNRVGKLVQTVDDVTCVGERQTLDPEYNAILLELSASEWTKLFSVILTGGDLVYPDESHTLHWAWVRGLECGMSFCQKMIECFQLDEDTREAMIQAFIAELLADAIQAEAWVSAMRQLGLGSSSGINATGTPNSGILGQILDTSCDPPTLYGKCFGAVEGLNEIAEQTLETIEVITNVAELVAELADNIPVLGAFGSSIVDVGRWLQDTMTETYFEAYNTTSKERYACLIYCAVINSDCILNFTDIRDAYRSELTSYLPPSPDAEMSEYLEWFITLIGLSDIQFVGAMHLFLLEILARAGYIYDSTWRTVKIAIETSDPIEPVCEDCLCIIPEVVWNWGNSDNYTIYPITNRQIDTGYPFFDDGSKSYATGVITDGTLPQDIEGFEAGCEYRWIHTTLWYTQTTGSQSKTATIAIYSDIDHTNLLTSFTVNVPYETFTTVHQELPTPISGQTTYYIVVSIPPHSSAYGFYQSVTTISSNEP